MTMSSFPWLTALVVWPLVAALATVLTGAGRGRPASGAASGGGAFSAGSARTVALVGSLVQVALLVGAFGAFDTSTAGTHQLTETYAWIPALGASYAVGVDGVSLLLVALSVGLVPLVILAAWREQGGDHVRLRRYLATVLVLLSFMVVVFAARDVFLFYVVFEAMLIPAYFLIGGFGQGAQRRYAAVKFLLFSLAGGLVMLAAVVALYLQVPVDPATGLRPEDAFLTENLTGLALDPTAERLMFAAFFLAFAIKAPMFPVHTWLPDVTQNATPGTSTLLICVLDKVGTFGMLTLCLPLFPQASRWAAPAIIVLAVISILYGAILAIGQTDVLRLIGYTSVSHFGFIILGIFTFTSLGISGASFMMLNHGISTGALFLLAGFTIARHPRRSQQIADYGGMRKVAPVLGGTFLVAGLSALALPGLATFVSEIMVFLGAYARWPAAVLVAVPAVVLAAVYVLLTYQRMFTGEVGAEVVGAKDLDVREKTVAGVLVAALVVLGLVPGPALDYVREPAGVSVEHVGETDPEPVLGALEGSEQ
ncbi:NADH-quinone oxidoreductase subunit M [Isoptericola halotolerans]